MTEPAIPRYLLLGARPEGAFRLARPDEPPILGDVAPGHGVRVRGDALLIESADGTLQTCDAAIAAGVVKLARAGNATAMRYLFQGRVRDQVWKSIVRKLGRDSVRDWSLTVRDDVLRLRNASSGVVAEYDATGWWLILDPDRAADIAGRLTRLVTQKSAA